MLIAISVMPVLALSSNDYIIEDMDSRISIIIEVSNSTSKIQDVFIDGMDSTLIVDHISNNGEISKIFGKSGDDYFYIIYDLGNDSIKYKIWTDSEIIRIISTPIVESIF